MMATYNTLINFQTFVNHNVSKIHSQIFTILEYVNGAMTTIEMNTNCIEI